MMNEVKWTKYLKMGLLSFAAILLELFSIFVIEKMVLHVDILSYTVSQRNIHSILTACLWAIFIVCILFYTRKHYHFPGKEGKTEKISAKDWIIAIVCLAGCKVMTFIDWHTLKIIGESKGDDMLRVVTQYIYYLFEVGLVFLIIMYGQKAAECFLKRESSIPYGGILLALTWGAFHFISRGVGLEIWNGVSSMIFSILSGVMYIKVKGIPRYGYFLIAIGYLL